MNKNKQTNKTTTNTKTLERTKNQLGAKTIYHLIILIGAILIFIAPLVHVYISKDNPSVVAYKKELSLKEKKYDNELIELRKKYDKRLLSAEKFIIQNDNLKALLTVQINKNNKLLKEKVDENRIFGWKTLRVFLVGFGIRLPYLLFSLIISFLIFKIKTDDKTLKKAFVYLQIGAYTTTFYNLAWCFWYSQDYPLETYRYAIIIVSALVATSVVYFISYRELFTMRLQKIVNALSRFTIIDARKYIKPESEKEYVSGYIEAIKKSMK